MVYALFTVYVHIEIEGTSRAKRLRNTMSRQPKWRLIMGYVWIWRYLQYSLSFGKATTHLKKLFDGRLESWWVSSYLPYRHGHRTEYRLLLTLRQLQWGYYYYKISRLRFSGWVRILNVRYHKRLLSISVRLIHLWDIGILWKRSGMIEGRQMNTVKMFTRKKSIPKGNSKEDHYL